MPDNSYPRITAAGIKVADMSHQRCIDVLVERMGYTALRKEQAELRAKGIHRGIGIAAFIKGTAPGPRGYYGAGGAPIASQDACTIKLEPGGGIICAVGVTEQGQGVDTVMGQIAASVLGVPMEQVRVISGDTDATPYGGGTYASRATAIGGEAVFQAAHELRSEILSLAGTLLQAAPSTLDLLDGHVVDAGSGRQRISLAEIGRIGHFQVGELPNSVQPVLSVTRRYRLLEDLYIFTNGIHGAYVEVDPDTGFIRLLKHWVVEDCGRIINPQLADEQVRGGCVQGLGGALYEHCIYDEAGQLVNGTMADYLTPMAGEMPDIEVAHVQTPTSVSELGAKGVGESGTGAAPAVVMNAVNDALAAIRRARDHTANDPRGHSQGSRQSVKSRGGVKAAVIEKQGGIENIVYRDFPDPKIGPGDLLIRVKACGLNYFDIFVRRGMPGLPVPMPWISGGDVAGEVAAVGRCEGLEGRRPLPRGPAHQRRHDGRGSAGGHGGILPRAA